MWYPNEVPEAAGDSTTPYALQPGKSFLGVIWGTTDVDWIAVDVTEGSAYRVRMQGEQSDRDLFFDEFGVDLVRADGTVLASPDGAPAYARPGLPKIENAVTGPGDDTITGNEFANRLRSWDGDDLIMAGGDDVVFADRGEDTVFGGAGDDHIYGGRDADRLMGEAGDDSLRGNFGNDHLAGRDDLRGGANDDTLLGGADGDYLFGGGQRDVLDGGAGNDSLWGGFGAGRFDGSRDVFVYSSTAAGGGGFDRIKDWEDAIDVIDLSAFGSRSRNAIRRKWPGSGAATTRARFARSGSPPMPRRARTRPST